MIVACPNCEKKLRLATLKSGQRVRCPECQTVFAPEAEEEEPPRKEAVTTRASSTRAPRREEVDEEEDERLRRPRRGRDEDEADEEPPEERADEEDEEERPRRQKKRRKQKAFPLLPVLGGGGVALAVGLVVFFLVSNPFGTSSAYAKHDALAKEMLSLMTDLMDTLDTVKDRNSARTAAQKIQGICDRLDKIAGEIGSLPKISVREDKKLQDAYAAKFNQVNGRAFSSGQRAGMNSQGEPSFLAALQRLEGVGRRLQSAKPKWGS